MKSVSPKVLWSSLQRSRVALVAIAMLAALGLQALVPMAVEAQGQVQHRSVTMSSAIPSATGVSYLVSFQTATTGNIKGIVVDFCTISPFIGDSSGCGAPAGFSMTATPTVTNTGLNAGTWTASSSGAFNTLIYTNGSATTSVPAGTTITVTISTITNPSAVATTGTPSAGTFYARFATYSDNTVASAYTATAPGSYIDYGGDALSTATPVNVTAKIEEALSFCVYIAACGDVPSIILGHGTTDTLDSSAVDTNPVSWTLSTNALNGASVNMKGTTLTSGSNTIAPVGGGTANSAITAGVAAFGVNVSAPGSGMTVNPNYASTTPGTPASDTYGFVNTNVTSTYGDSLATSTGPLNASISTITFAATASSTTPAGIYTTTESLIATGTF